MRNRLELAGREFGRDGVFTARVLALDGVRSRPGRRSLTTQCEWRCLCLRCGGEFLASSIALTSGRRLDCGCVARAAWAARTPRRRRDCTRLRWRHMMNRCRNAEAPDYPLYGGRDIRVCEGLADRETYRAHVGDQPGPGLTVERRNNDGHYSCGACAECREKGWPDNVQWGTRHEQGLNRRPYRSGAGGRAPAHNAARRARLSRLKQSVCRA